MLTDHFKITKKIGCRNTKLGHNKNLSAHVWTSCAAWAHEEEDMKQTKKTERHTVQCTRA